MVTSRSVNMVSKAPTRQLHSNTRCCLWSGHTRKQSIIHWRCHPKESRPKVPKSVLRAVFGRVHFTLHATHRTPHGASLLVQAMSAWLVKTRRAPSRHSRDARVNGHTTTTMHKLRSPQQKVCYLWGMQLHCFPFFVFFIAGLLATLLSVVLRVAAAASDHAPLNTESSGIPCIGFMVSAPPLPFCFPPCFVDQPNR